MKANEWLKRCVMLMLNRYRIFREISRGLYVVFSYFHADVAYSMMRFIRCVCKTIILRDEGTRDGKNKYILTSA